MNYPPGATLSYRWQAFSRRNLHAERWTRDGRRVTCLRAHSTGGQWWAEARVEWWGMNGIARTLSDAVPVQRREAKRVAEALAARLLRDEITCPECGAEGRVA